MLFANLVKSLKSSGFNEYTLWGVYAVKEDVNDNENMLSIILYYVNCLF